MKKKATIRKLTKVDVKIVKMRESSGNEQFFVRLVRNDTGEDSFFTDGILEYNCWQTKSLDKNECLSRAWFDASFAARFVGLKSMDGVILVGFDDEETAILKSSMSILREPKKSRK